MSKSTWPAIKAKDADAAMHVTDDGCIITGAQGIARIDRQTLMRMMKAATYTLPAFALSEPQVRLLPDDVAILAYKVHEQLTVENEAVTLDAADASTWVRRNDGWICALHTESILGDPFGRDRASLEAEVEMEQDRAVAARA